MIEEIRLYAERQADFGFETTLSGRTHLNLIRDLRKRGYSVHVFFLWVSGVDLALSRIRDRVKKGGHDVRSAVVRRRFERSMKNFFTHYRRLADSWFVLDNSGAAPRVIAVNENGELQILQEELYSELSSRYTR